MIAILALAMQMDHRATLPTAPRIACTPAIVAANAPAGWASPVAVSSGATIATGRAATLTLQAAARAGFAAPPARPAAMGATVAVVVPRAGRWRVSLDAPLWIDLIAADRKPAVSVAHAHGRPCSGVAKTVDFDLPAGRYVLQFSGATAATVRVMLAAG